MPQPLTFVHVRLQKRVMCPHCWHVFPPEEVLWIAQHAELVGDPKLGRDQPRRFLPTRFDVTGNALDARGFPCTGLACPRCHLETPRAMLELPAHLWSILGAPACGKSYFLAAMTWQLRRILTKQFAVAFSDVDPTFNRILNEYEELIFLNPNPSKLVAIRKTELQGDLYNTVLFGEQAVTYPRPFVFAMRVLKDHPTHDASKQFGRTLCIYDNAGEHFLPGQDSADTPVTRHLAQSRVLMFLFDPTQDPRFRKACMGLCRDPQLADHARTSRQEIVLLEAANRIRRFAGLSQTEKHGRPLIVIVTKFDAWAPLLGNPRLAPPYAKTPGSNLHAVDLSFVHTISQQTRSLLWDYTPEIVSAAESFADEVYYVPVSATGKETEVDPSTGLLGVRSSDMNPIWVEVPVLMAMCKWIPGLIPTTATGLQPPMFRVVQGGRAAAAASPAPASPAPGTEACPAKRRTLPIHDDSPDRLAWRQAAPPKPTLPAPQTELE